MHPKNFIFLFGWLALAVLSASAQTRLACQELTNARLANHAIIASAEAVAAEPARCKVTGTIEQTIGFEVNLPANWNNKLLVVGIGGNAGTITDTSIGWRRNYATATTDTGHKGNGGDTSWALNNPQGEANFAHRAFHLTTVTAKEIIRQFYGTAAIIGNGTNPARTRPLCAYPKVARYNGAGSKDEASSFRCVMP